MGKMKSLNLRSLDKSVMGLGFYHGMIEFSILIGHVVLIHFLFLWQITGLYDCAHSDILLFL